MRVSWRAFVLGCLVAVCAPGAASAAPILGGSGGTACPSLVTAPSCGQFSVDPLSGAPLEVMLQNHQDILLLQFELLVDSLLSITTTPFNTSEVLGPVLGVFRGSPLDPQYLDVVTIPDPASAAEFRALGEVVSPSDPSAPGLTPLVLGQGIYLLAVLSPQNLFGGVAIESLAFPFTLDSENLPCGPDEGCAFSLSFNTAPVEGGPDPVPEPATLTLMAGGAAAALIRRRRQKRQTRP